MSDNLKVLKEKIETDIDPNGAPGSILAENHQDILFEVLDKVGNKTGFAFTAEKQVTTFTNGKMSWENNNMLNIGSFNIKVSKLTKDLNNFGDVLGLLSSPDILKFKDYVGRSAILEYVSHVAGTDGSGNDIYTITVKGKLENPNYIYQDTESLSCMFEIISQSGTGGGGGADGKDGESAYEVAVNNGFIGTEQEWLDSLVGTDGEDGANGVDGTPGVDGTNGIDGTNGVDGQGVPVGGTANQILRKVDNVDFNTEWSDENGSSVIVLSKTGTNIVFTENAYYNEITPLTTGTLTLDLTGAVKGINTFVHCDRYVPSITGDFIYKTTNRIDVNSYNILRFEYDGTNVYLTVYNSVYLLTPSATIESGNTQLTISEYFVENALSYEILFNEVENNYVDETALFADQGNQTNGKIQEVTSTFKYYEYLGTTNGDLTDYLEIGETETGSAVTVPSFNGVDLTYIHTGLTNDTTYFYWIKGVGKGFFDDVYATLFATPEEPVTLGSGLNFDKAFDETITLTSQQDFAGVFYTEFNMSFSDEDLGYVPLCSHSTSNRMIISNTNSKILMSVSGASLEVSFSFQFDTLYNIVVYRDVSNDVYVEIDEASPLLLGNTTNVFSVSTIGKGTSTRRLTGFIDNFTIGDDIFLLEEGTGTALTAENAATATFNSTGDASHINNISWASGPPLVSNNVSNLGVSGNNTAQILARMSDFIGKGFTVATLMVGTNDSLNSGAYIDVNTFKTNLISIVQQLQADGITVVLLTILPAIDSYLKARHDYTSIYGDESLFNVNDKVLLYNTAIEEVSVSESTGFVDVWNSFDANGEPSELSSSWLRNTANSGSDDGVHPTAIGASEIGTEVGNYLLTQAYDVSSVVCIGNSITVGVNLVGAGTNSGQTYPAKIKEIINP